MIRWIILLAVLEKLAIWKKVKLGLFLTLYTHTPARDRNTHSKEIKDQNVKKKSFFNFQKKRKNIEEYFIPSKFLSRYTNYNYKGKFCNVEIHWNLKLLSDKDFYKRYLKEKLQIEKRYFLFYWRTVDL